jgi:uncharacterized integral membrane protein
MRLRTSLVILVVTIAAAFLILNWKVLAASATFSLGLGSFNAPVGVVMLAIFGIIVVTLTIYMGISQSSLLLEYRRQAKELQAQRVLADNAEASRFTEMGTLLHDEMAALAVRLETALEAMREEFRNTEGSIAATLGEMDDRIQRMRKP